MKRAGENVSKVVCDQGAIICVKMASIDELSNELLVHVFKYLHSSHSTQTNLLSCLLVTRRWHHLALPIVWSTLHLDFDWKRLYESRKVLRELGEPGCGYNRLLVLPTRLDEFFRSLDLQERKSLDPIEWCTTLTFCITGIDHSVDTTSAAEIISTILRCNNVRDLHISLDLREN